MKTASTTQVTQSSYYKLKIKNFIIDRNIAMSTKYMKKRTANKLRMMFYEIVHHWFLSVYKSKWCSSLFVDYLSPDSFFSNDLLYCAL